MLKRKRIWLALAGLLALGLGAYFEPTHCVRGWLYGEAFFEGRPTSYWRSLILKELGEPRDDLVDESIGRRKRSSWESFWESVGFRITRHRSHALLFGGSGDADQVLRELSADRSPAIRAYADHLSHYKSNELPRVAAMEPPFGLDILVYMPWLRALDKAREAKDAE